MVSGVLAGKSRDTSGSGTVTDKCFASMMSTVYVERATGYTDLEERHILTQFGEYNIICCMMAGDVLM